MENIDSEKPEVGDERIVNYPTLLAHGFRRSLLEGGDLAPEYS